MGADIYGWVEVNSSKDREKWFGVIGLHPFLTRSPPVQHKILGEREGEMEPSQETESLGSQVKLFASGREDPREVLEQLKGIVNVVSASAFRTRYHHYRNEIKEQSVGSWDLLFELISTLCDHYGQTNVRISWWTEYDPLPPYTSWGRYP